MAGHSKWANIKHEKAKKDKQRGKVYTKLIREITSATRAGSDDPATNPRLRLAVDVAFGQNMSKDTIERAIKRGAGGMDSDQLEEILYEGYGSGGVAVLVECMTDNRNRTVAEVRHAFTKCGGNLGTNGSVAYLFNKRGLLVLPASYAEDRVMEVALEAGAEDVISEADGTFEVFTAWEDFSQVKSYLIAEGLTPERAEVTLLATTHVTVGRDDAEKMLQLLDKLEDLDDVQQVYSNAEIPDDILAELTKD